MERDEIEELVHQTSELTGSPPPELMDEDSPALRESGGEERIYLVGLIGGKEVGKSALVNALAGSRITDETSHGPGTQIVVAYVHRAAAAELETLLRSAAPGQYRIVPHDNERLGGQVLLDLPDIDSRFTEHLELTRRMLRHMLFPIWVQSVEKYADVQPQKLLAKVAAGNDPANFLFCLNKVDQLPDDPSGAGQLRADYAARMARVLSLDLPPRVFLLSAIHPKKFDLPELSGLLSRQKSADAVAHSRQLADRQRQRSMLAWLLDQDLSGRAARLARLDEESSELLGQRLGVVLAERALPAMLDDPAYRLVMTDGVFSRRVSRWPIVNVLHSLLWPMRMVVGSNLGASSTFSGAAALVDAHLPAGNASIARLTQSAFAQLHQSNPAVAPLYERRKLWDTMEADLAEGRLHRDLTETIERQRQMLLARLSGRRGAIAPLFRVLLTIGALLWFPLVQPVLKAILESDSAIHGARNIAILIVSVLSTTSLLSSAVFLILWYLLLWSLLRWDTRRRVDRLLSRWKTADQPDSSLNLTTCMLEWIDDLLEPIRAQRATAQALAQRVETLQLELGEKAAA
jgi:hypothetical protein